MALTGYAALSVIAAAIVLGGVLSVPGAVQRTDHLAYQAAGRIVLGGEGSGLYDRAKQLAAEQSIAGDAVTVTTGLPFNNPPSLGVLHAPLASLPQPMAFAVWTALGVGVFAWGMWELAPNRPHRRLLVVALAVSAWPVVASALRGQVSLLVAGTIGASVAWASVRPHASGVLLGIATLKPTLVPLIAFALLVHRPRIALFAAGTFALMVALTIAIVGVAPWLEYPAHVLGQLGSRNAAGIHVDEMVNWRAVSSWVGGSAGLVIAVLGSAITVALTVWILFRTKGARPMLSMAAVLVATPLLIPHANQHEAILAVPAWIILTGIHGLPRWLPPVGIALHAVGWAALPLWGTGGSMLMFGELLLTLALIALIALRVPTHKAAAQPSSVASGMASGDG